jgi:hypothetical protein
LPGTAKALFLDAAGAWQDAAAEQTDQTCTIRIDVTRIKDGTTKLLLNPPASLDYNDRNPPEVRALIVDGAPVAAQPVVDLGATGTPPRRVGFTVADAGNAIAAGAVEAFLGGQRLAAACQPGDGGKAVVCAVDLPELDHGPHELRFTAMDTSPFRNRVEFRVQFTFLDTGNVAQASLGARVKVDSLFAGYTAAPLNDGDSRSCARAGSPQATWASAETADEHWVEIQLAQPETIDTLTVYWAYKKPSQRVEVQVLDNGKWSTIAVGEAKLAEQVATTIRFEPVTTDQVRLWQPVGCGSRDRPNLAWIGEISVGKAK